VFKAAKHLVKTSELFKKEHIDVQEDWCNNVNGPASSEHDDWEQFVNFSTSIKQIDVHVLHYHEWTYRAFNNTEQLISEPITDSKNNDGDHGWSEVENQPPIRCYKYFITRTRYD